MNDAVVGAFNNQIFNQDGSESAILKINYYNPLGLIIQHLPVKETVNKIEVNRMRNEYVIDTLTTVDVQEIVKIGVKYLKFLRVLFIQKIFKNHHLEKNRSTIRIGTAI